MNNLDINGYEIIPNILSHDECINFRNRIWDELKYVSNNKFDYQIEDSWTEFDKFKPEYSMLLHNYSLGHMQPIWDIRQHPKIYNVFENIWSTSVDNLLVSFDGLSVLLPPEKTNKGWVSDEWFHTDQSSLKIGKHCIQGMITLYDINKDDATLNILEGSHNYHQSFFEDNHIINKSDWYLLKDNQKDYFISKGCIDRSINANIGSMILWDSRVIHQAKGVDINRSNCNFRMVIYISMMPRSSITNPKLLKNRQKAFNNLRISSHWTNSLFLFGNQSSDDLNKIHQPVLNNIGRRLVGFDL
jgi:hypothetical protein